MEVHDAITDLLALWVLLAATAGLLLSDTLALLRPLVLPVLAVMVGSMGLTLSPASFRRVRPRALVTVLLLQAAMAPLAWALGRAAGLGAGALLGLVVLGAVTPELTTPVMTQLARGDVALATGVLVVTGLLSVVLVPGWMVLLVGQSVPFDPLSVLRPLALAVVLPVTLAVAARARWPDAVARGDRHYPAVSALMVVVVMALVVAANAGTVRAAGGGLLPVAAVVAVALNGAGYGLGWAGGRAAGLDRGEGRASTLCVGMRDFAVAAGVVVAAGLPAAAAVPAVVFGVVEMASAAGLARWWRGR